MTYFPKLGEILIQQGFSKKEHVEEALSYQKTWGGKIGDILLAHKFISEEQLTKALAQASGLPAIDLSRVELSREARRHIEGKFCHEHVLVPIMLKRIKDKDHLVVAVSDPLDLDVIEEIRYMVNLPVYRVVATASMIKASIFKLYPRLIEELPTSADLLSISELNIGSDRLLEMEQLAKETATDTTYLEKTGEFDTHLSPRASAKAFRALVKILRSKGLLTQSELTYLIAILEMKK